MGSTYETASDASSDSEVDYLAPMRLCDRPPQFYCAASPLTAGKTSTTITEMENMLTWFLNQGGLVNSSVVTPFKKIIHLIFVNNSLIEGEQWADRLITRGIQKMRIFSSQSDVNNANRLYQLITEGQYDDVTNTFSPIEYVLQCTNGVRLSDYCEDKHTSSGTIPSILKRMLHFHSDVGFVIWADEIDKLANLWKTFIPKMRKFPNLIQINGITATAYEKYWDLVHSLGFGDIPLIGSLPDASDYRTIRDHKLIYTDEISIKSPAKNFEYLLTHKEEACYIETDPKTSKEIKRLHIPDLKTNKGKIYYVPGQVEIFTHTEIAKIGNKYSKNSLVINGKFKGFKYADGRKDITVKDYKEEKIKKNILYKQPNGKEISFKDMAYMDIAAIMYNDPELNLKNTDLVITGYNCITRGVTFNRPDFQFEYVILSEYHYKEGSKQVEEIIQAVGRAHGNKSWVKEGIIFLSPKYILDMVDEKIQTQIDFLRTAPKTINYADVFRDIKGIPIKVIFHTKEILDTIHEFKQLTEKKRIGFMNILREAVADGSITLHDVNTVRDNQVKFNLNEYTIESKRMLDDPKKAKSYRFAEFLDNYTKRIPYGQSVKKEGLFNIDITYIEQKVSDTQRIEAGTGFISFMFITKKAV